ncbi:MAG: ribosome assembly cofactor RimP [Bacteroidetes bacterium]|jgi:ribosome maturation factor RimP|nr:ribosome assembly cofactor RimP [Bacteroidota bacterium]MDA0879353.1 ribosome assembly cofactor RimP [Bacteroidota bacterium]MDA1114959.1 ribosome assembly cofactor RimP [Bacteroidota bacterium]
MLKETVQILLNDALQERQDLFLVEFDVSSANHINVVLDGDEGVTVKDCVFISRAIEHNLDRETVDFSLEVASAGAASPIVMKRQYVKNVGKTMEITTKDGGKYQGVLQSTSQEYITIAWKAREPKAIGKGKVNVEKMADLNYDDIAAAKVKLKFN